MYFYITLISAIATDFITKYIAQLYLIEKVNLIGDTFFLRYTQNTGIAFGINLPFIKIITIILISLIFYYYFKEEKKKKNKLLDIAFGLIIGGAIGNGIERIFFSKVTDFIGVSFFSIFNFADIFICVGAIIFFVYLFKSKE